MTRARFDAPNRWMRLRAMVLPASAGLAALWGCDGGDSGAPKIAVSSYVATENPNIGRLWPALLQHCLRSLSCDPTDRFGEGAGEASGIEKSATWFAQSAEAVGEDGGTYGARLTVSVHGPAYQGGKAGRPLGTWETPPNLRAPTVRRSWLQVEYRAPNGVLQPYFLVLRTPQIAIGPKPLKKLPKREDLVELTQQRVDRWVWPDGSKGARLSLSDSAGRVLLRAYSTGRTANADLEEDPAKALGVEPWVFQSAVSLIAEGGRERAGAEEVLAALLREESLNFLVSSPEGDLLYDEFKTEGFAVAISSGTEALADPDLVSPLTERCLPLLETEDWNATRLSPVLATCDPRTPDQRRQPGDPVAQ